MEPVGGKIFPGVHGARGPANFDDVGLSGFTQAEVYAQVVGRVIAVAGANLVDLGQGWRFSRSVGLGGQQGCAGLGNHLDACADAGAVRFVFVPAIVLSGFWMYAGVLFAVIGVAIWLAAFYLAGFWPAILSQVALFIARKTWLVLRARHSKGSGLSPS